MVYLVILSCLYFFPTLIVLHNKHASADDRLGVAVVNLLFGWSGIGWIVAATLAQVDYENGRKVKQARDNFYLREEERFKAGDGVSARREPRPSRPARTRGFCLRTGSDPR